MNDQHTPSALDALEGNEQLKSSLLAALAAGRLCHSVLLCGEAGTGAGFAARCLAADFLYPGQPDGPGARAILAGESPEVLVLTGSGASGDIKIDDVRAVRREVFNTALSAAGRVVLIQGADRLNTSSANALLKVIEEPPENVLFILTAPGEAAVLPTIRSRCCAYSLAPVPVEACDAWLRSRFPLEADVHGLSVLFGGKIGAAARCLQDPAARRQLADAKALAAHIAAGDEYGALALLAGYEKDKPGARQLLALLCSVCAWALRDAAAPLPPALAAQVLPLAQTASQQLRANVSPKLALTVCAMHCCAASLS